MFPRVRDRLLSSGPSIPRGVWIERQLLVFDPSERDKVIVHWLPGIVAMRGEKSHSSTVEDAF